MANSSRMFVNQQQLRLEGWSLSGNIFLKEREKYLPLYEGKMVDSFNHRAASVFTNTRNLKRPGQPVPISSNERANPYTAAIPQYWVSEDNVDEQYSSILPNEWAVTFKKITSPTNERTVIGALLPRVGIADSIVIVFGSNFTANVAACLMTNLNSFILDYVSRQKLGGLNLAHFIVNQFPVVGPKTYSEPVPWQLDVNISHWINIRALELTFTAWDMQPFAIDTGYDGPPFRWDTDRRFLLRCELDAAFFHLYGIGRDDVDYIMETFPIVKRHDERDHGEYRTKRVILEIYDEMKTAMDYDAEYQTRLDPPPGDPQATHQTTEVN